MDPCPPVSGAKRVFIYALLLLIVGLIGGYAALWATAPKIPIPWGEIRLMQYSTNASGTTMAHFRFQNLFQWPVFLEVGLEVNNGRSWEMARGYLMFMPIEKAVAPKASQSFAVPVPFESKEWHVLVRAANAAPSNTDLRREKIKRWLDTHGAGFLGKEIKVEDPNGYIMPGPLMKWDKPGRMATPYYESAVRLAPWEPSPVAARTTHPRR
ncbi:MAG TPA: hypothetical protein VJ063_10420 [Verrucomicrobiae bacterium]|nr:hypothetical protein [Verrucomicrobiae bacterium]